MGAVRLLALTKRSSMSGFPLAYKNNVRRSSVVERKKASICREMYSRRPPPKIVMREYRFEAWRLSSKMHLLSPKKLQLSVCGSSMVATAPYSHNNPWKHHKSIGKHISAKDKKRNHKKIINFEMSTAKKSTKRVYFFFWHCAYPCLCGRRLFSSLCIVPIVKLVKLQDPDVISAKTDPKTNLYRNEHQPSINSSTSGWNRKCSLRNEVNSEVRANVLSNKMAKSCPYVAGLVKTG